MMVFQLKSKGKTCGIAIDSSYPIVGDEQPGRKPAVPAQVPKAREVKPADATSTYFEKPAKDLSKLVYSKGKK